jgi:hypothetical protein
MFERDAFPGESSFGVAVRGEEEEEEEDASAVGTREVLGGVVGVAIDDGRSVVGVGALRAVVVCDRRAALREK